MNKLNQLSVGKQVLLTFGVLCAILLLIGGSSFFSLRAIERSNEVQQSRALKKVVLIDHTAQGVGEMQAEVLREVLASDPGEIRDFDQTVHDIEKTNARELADYQQFADTEKERRLCARVTQARKAYWDRTQPVLALAIANQDAEATILINSTQLPAYDEFVKAINALIKYVEADAGDAAKATSRFIFEIRMIGDVLGGFGLLIASGMGRSVVKVTRRLREDNRVLQDEIKERKRAEEQLRVQATVLDAAANAIVITDHNGAIQLVNPAFTTLTGYTAPELLGKNLRLLKSGKQDEAFYRNLWQTISAGQVWRGELTNRRKDGSLYTEEMTITPVRSADGTIARYIAIKQDVSKRKRAEEELRASQQIMEGILNAIPVRVFWKDKNLVYLGCNAIFARDAGFAHSQDIIGKDDYQMAWRDQAEYYRAGDRQVIESGVSRFLIEESQTTPQGNTIHLLTSKIPLRGSKGEITGVLGTYVDITARKQAEEKVKLFRTLIERSNDGIYVADPATGRFLDANESAFHGLGYTRDELLALTVFDVTAGVDRATFEAGNAKLEKSGHAMLEVSHRRKDGSTYPVEVGLSFVTLDRKYLVSIVRDITERKQMENVLRESEEKFRQMAENIADVFWMTSPDLQQVYYVSPAYERIWGRTAASLVEHPREWVQAVLPEERDRVWAAFGRLTKGEAGASEEFRIARPDGKMRWIHSRGFHVLDAAGKVIGLTGIASDITARKQAEAQLINERELLRALLNSAPVAIYFKDRQSRFLRCSAVMARHFRLNSPEEVVGKSDFDFQGKEHARQAFEDEQEIIRTGRPMIGKTEKEEWPDGLVTWALTSKMPFYDNQGEIIGTFGISKNITSIKEAEAKVEQLHKQLLQNSRLAGMAEIATNVLHNVGNVLNSVNISADVIAASARMSKVSSLARVAVLLQEHAHDLGQFLTHDPRGRQVPVHLARLSEHLASEQAKIVGELDSLRHNVEHIKKIVAMQQNYAMVGGVKEMTDLGSLVEDSLRLNESALSRHGVEVVRELAKLPPMNVEKHKILQILVNLLRNAKYACDESGRTDGRLTVRLAKDDGRVKISVMDNGIGIPPENLTRIFNYGFTTRGGGHGFGLHGCALAAKEMGGSLAVQSGGPGHGAVFTLELPGPTRENSHE